MSANQIVRKPLATSEASDPNICTLFSASFFHDQVTFRTADQRSLAPKGPALRRERSLRSPKTPCKPILRRLQSSPRDHSESESGIESAISHTKQNKKPKGRARKVKLSLSTLDMAVDSSTAAPSPTTPFTARTPAPQVPPKPSYAQIQPHLLDIVPSTERLLSRLLLPAPGLQGDDTFDNGSQSVAEHKKHLDVQHLDQAANSVRNQIHKARQAIKELPDMNRTVAEQNEEMAWLEDRITRMQDMMDKVRKDVQMQPVTKDDEQPMAKA